MGQPGTKLTDGYRGQGRTGVTRTRGVVLTTMLALLAAFFGSWFPTIGGPVFGIAFGMLVNATGRVGPSYRPGIGYSSKRLLQYAIVLLGAGLSLDTVISTGKSSLLVMLGTLSVCLLAAWVMARMLHISGDLGTLIGVGTAICGASAIAAVAPVVEAKEQDVAYAISTIFLFNVLAVLIFPPLGLALGLSQETFGLWAGTAINDTSSVVAAAYTFGADAGNFATVVKLTRSTLIIPISLTLAGVRILRTRRTSGDAKRVEFRRLVPWFIVWFLVASLLNTVGVLPPGLVDGATATAKFLIVVALTAVGLSANFGQMAKTGFKPVFMGMVLWVVIASTCLAILRWTGPLL